MLQYSVKTNNLALFHKCNGDMLILELLKKGGIAVAQFTSLVLLVLWTRLKYYYYFGVLNES